MILLTFLRTYPYMAWSLLVLGAFALTLAACPARHRRGAILGGLLALPCALSGALLCVLLYLTGEGALSEETVYWAPVRIGSPPIPLGVEDFVYSFAAGGIAWILAIGKVRDRLVLRPRHRQVLVRLGLAHACGLLLAAAACETNARPMSCLLAPAVIVGMAVLAVRPRNWRIAARGAAGFTIFQFLLLKALFVAAPEFRASWNTDSLWGPALWDVPLDEIAFAATFGAVWPLFVSHALDGRPLLGLRPNRETHLLLSQAGCPSADAEAPVRTWPRISPLPRRPE